MLVAGARPNFMKIAPIIRAMEKHGGFDWTLVHTGQHYDYEMSQAFFDDLELPAPDIYLEAGPGTHAEQTARIMTAYELACFDETPDMTLVVGDVNSTLACSIVSKKLGIPVVHVEAGLRSFDMTMPEEINRIVTDSISDLFFVTEEQAIENLKREGKPLDRIFFVGHVMIDNLFHQMDRLEKEHSNFPHAGLKTRLGDYVFMTLHRPSNVDNQKILNGIVSAVNAVSKKIPVVFPVHPRTQKMLNKFGMKFSSKVFCLPPLGFKESLFFWKDAKAVLTDSGGLQEETTALGVPCITLRENTERPVTCELGTNQLVGNKPNAIIQAIKDALNGNRPQGTRPPLWDGRAAKRIVEILAREAANIQKK